MTTLLAKDIEEYGRLRENASGASLTTFSVGGRVSLLIEPSNISELSNLIERFSKSGVKWRLLGFGSNVVIPDSGVTEPVIRLGEAFSRMMFIDESSLTLEQLGQLQRANSQPGLASPGVDNQQTVSVLVFGAHSLIGISRKLSASGLSGLEFAAGIPGSVGGALRMNAGAHGSEMSELVEQAFVLTATGEYQIWTPKMLGFAYRRTALPENSIVVAAFLRLTKRAPLEVSRKRRASLEYRKRTQPLHLPSAGSVFRNPEQPVEGKRRFAAELLEAAGLKGYQEGGVCYSTLHANWLVKARDDATAKNVSTLIELGKERVEERFGVKLKPEIILW